MSTKFEQLLDLLVNEDMEGANALFHEIVVEKSRTIYENLIAEEEDEEMEEAADEEADESVEEGAESDDEEMDESREEDMDESEEELEDSYMMDSEDDGFEGGEEGDAADEFGDEIGSKDDEHGHEGQEDSAIYDIKNAIAELEAAFAELEAAQDSEEAEMGMDDEEGDDEMMGQPAFEGRRMTREYVEKVGHNYGGNTQKQQGDYAGAGTGENQSRPVEGKSPVSSGKGKPTTGATASNILGDQSTAEGHSTGTTPNKVNKGITPEKSEQFTGKDWETNSAPGGKAGVKNLKKQGAGYPGNNKSAGPVGSGTGDKAGQTSVSSDKPFLKKL